MGSCSIDVIFATSYDQSPVLTVLAPPIAVSPLRPPVQIRYVPLSCPLLPADPSRTTQMTMGVGGVADRILECAWQSTRDCFARVPRYRMTNAQFDLLHTPITFHDSSDWSSKAAEVCRLAARIHCQAVAVEPVGYGDPANKDDALAIQHLINQIEVREMLLSTSQYLFAWV